MFSCTRSNQELCTRGVVKGQHHGSPGNDASSKGETHGALGKVSNFCKSILAKTSCGPAEEPMKGSKNLVYAAEAADTPIRITPFPDDGVKSRGSKKGEVHYNHRHPPWGASHASDLKKKQDLPGGDIRKKRSSHKLPHMPEDIFPQRPKGLDPVDSMIPSRLFPSTSSLPSISQENTIDVEDLILDKQVGRGAFGRVYKATLHGDTMALKIITHLASQSTMQVAPELDLLHGICHPNIVHVKAVLQGMEGILDEEESMTYNDRNSCVSSFFSDFARQLPEKNGGGANSDTWVIMEYCNQGSLWDAVQRGDFRVEGEGKKIQYGKVMEVALEVAFAMQHLHEVGIIHGDLKAQNVMLQGSKSASKNFVAKVGDFGLCRRTYDRKDMTTQSVGTVDHMPPEVLQSGKVSSATDVFSFSILLHEMITGKRPFEGLDTPAIIVGIVEGVRPKIPESCPGRLANVMTMCWKENWQERPTFGEVVKLLKDIMFPTIDQEAESRIPRHILAQDRFSMIDGLAAVKAPSPERKDRIGVWPNALYDRNSSRKQRNWVDAHARRIEAATGYQGVHFDSQVCTSVCEMFEIPGHELPRFHRVQDMR